MTRADIERLLASYEHRQGPDGDLQSVARAALQAMDELAELQRRDGEAAGEPARTPEYIAFLKAENRTLAQGMRDLLAGAENMQAENADLRAKLERAQAALEEDPNE